MPITILEHGQWQGEPSGGYVLDAPLAHGISTLLYDSRCRSVMDIGCGNGGYVQSFRQSGLRADGTDGNPDTWRITDGMCSTRDFAIPVVLERDPFDAVVSLEVGEHVPATFEGVFLNNVCGHARKVIVLSWAIPGQDGLGHVNCHSNAYVAGEMRKRGWNRRELLEEPLRSKAAYQWFRNTVMVFTPSPL